MYGKVVTFFEIVLQRIVFASVHAIIHVKPNKNKLFAHGNDDCHCYYATFATQTCHARLSRVPVAAHAVKTNIHDDTLLVACLAYYLMSLKSRIQ